MNDAEIEAWLTLIAGKRLDKRIGRLRELMHHAGEDRMSLADRDVVQRALDACLRQKEQAA